MLFWGAGATASLGLRTTDQQAEFLRALAPGPEKSDVPSLRTRVRTALGDCVPDRWVDAFSDLLEILGECGGTNAHKVSAAEIHEEQLVTMARNWGCNVASKPKAPASDDSETPCRFFSRAASRISSVGWITARGPDGPRRKRDAVTTREPED